LSALPPEAALRKRATPVVGFLVWVWQTWQTPVLVALA
jgi:hypothetical protein